MSKKKIILLIICGTLISFAILREIGLVDVNLYQSALSTSQSARMAKSHSGEQEHFSYHLTIRHKDRILHNHTHMYNNLPQIEIEAILDEPRYTGNFRFPLVKSFRMTYLCKFTTTNSPSGHKMEGEIEGEVNMKIHGLCSRSKAKELAFEDAEKHIKSYFQDQLNNR